MFSDSERGSSRTRAPELHSNHPIFRQAAHGAHDFQKVRGVALDQRLQDPDLRLTCPKGPKGPKDLEIEGDITFWDLKMGNPNQGNKKEKGSIRFGLAR